MAALETIVIITLATVFSISASTGFVALYLRRGFRDSASGGGVEDAKRANDMLLSQYRQVRTELDELKREMKVLRHWALLLQQQIFKLGGTPVSEQDAARAVFGEAEPPKDNGKAPLGDNTEQARNALIELLSTRFTSDEVFAIAIEAGLREDDMAGDTQRKKVIRIVQAAYNNGIGTVSRLTSAMERYRPSIFKER